MDRTAEERKGSSRKHGILIWLYAFSLDPLHLSDRDAPSQPDREEAPVKISHDPT